MTVPTRLDNSVDPAHVCAQYDVMFNGKRQTQCIIADVADGYIVRYKSIHGVIVRNAGKFVIERLTGKVEIVPRTKSSGL